MEVSTEVENPITSSFECDCEIWMREACAGLPYYKEYEGKRYCILHFPGKEKSAEFNETLRTKLEAKDFNFQGVWFPAEALFENFEFGARANFVGAKFSAGANFIGAKFSAEAYFIGATFSAGANFDSATFSALAYFSVAKFSARADFRRAKFSAGANFDMAKFSDSLSFTGTEQMRVFSYASSVSFQSARIERPDRISFHTVDLLPHWFVNIDPRKFEFTNVRWLKSTVNEEVERLESKGVTSPRRLLSIACRNLAVNAEENHRYEEASMFRYWSMESRRPEKWQGFAFWKTDWFHLLYWAASGYGERILRAFVWLIVIWFLFALPYWNAPFVERAQRELKQNEEPPAPYVEQVLPMDFRSACVYSFGVMTLQRPEPRPVKRTTKALVVLETVLGPLQAALLALAIRRKFMR